MAGASIKIESEGFAKVIDIIQDIAAKSGKLEPVMADIGEQLLLSHQERNAKAEAPDGTAWAALSETTQQLKPRHQNNPLRLNDILLNQLLYVADDTGLEFGSNMIYAAMQHFGGVTSPNSMIPNKEIVARPFIGMTTEDEQLALDTVEDYLLNLSAAV